MSDDPKLLLVQAEMYRNLARHADEPTAQALLKQAEALETEAFDIMARQGGKHHRSLVRQFIWVLVGLLALGVLVLMIVTPTLSTNGEGELASTLSRWLKPVL